ncbi:MAG: hypothetical protein AAGA91_16890 [Pseudomonadota bacterium]
MKFTARSALALSLLALANTGSAFDYIAPENLPEWLRVAVSNDKTVEGSTPIIIEELSVSGAVQGKATLVEQDEEVLYYQIDIGTDTPVECYSLATFDGPANSLYGMLSVTTDAIAQSQKKPLLATYNFASDVGVVDHTPYLGLELMFLIGEDASPIMSMVKGFSAEVGDRLQLCIHQEIGYRSAFFSVFESFVTAFTSTESDPGFFANVFLYAIGDMPVGYAMDTFSFDEDDDVYNRSTQSLLIPTDETSVSSTDFVLHEWSSVDGAIISSDRYTIENGELASEFELWVEDDQWQVAGQLQGKTLNTTLQHDSGLLSGFGQYLEAARIRTTDQTESEFFTFVAEADPTAAIPIVLEEIKGNEDANLRMTMGPMQIDALLDGNGIFREMKVSQGPLVLTMSSLYSKGELLPQ